jgi:hypothetical protein
MTSSFSKYFQIMIIKMKPKRKILETSTWPDCSVGGVKYNNLFDYSSIACRCCFYDWIMYKEAPAKVGT